MKVKFIQITVVRTSATSSVEDKVSALCLASHSELASVAAHELIACSFVLRDGDTLRISYTDISDTTRLEEYLNGPKTH